MKKIFLSAFVFLLVFLFSTCEIGLGASVDTEAPVISVLRPSLENVDVIKGSFPIMGDWSDDGAIDSIKITLKGNDGIEHEYTAPADKAEGKANEGTWYCAIDPVADKITDGSYSVEVVIKDKAGHKTASLAQIVIDNTAPIVVLTRPSTSAQSSSFDTYGQTFTLEGQAADTNNISRIDVHLYEDADCTISVGTVSLPNVPNSINMDAAKYNAEKESYINEQNSDFAISVPKDSDGKQFYCQIVAYDGAIQYPMDGSEPSGEYLNGNSINSYYLYKDISTSILQNYKITEVYSMLSGTYSTDTSRAAAASEVLKLLDDKKIEVGKFALNPRNNPTFSVTGRSPLAMDGNDFKGTTHNVSNGQSLVVEVSPGLDGILLEESSIKVYAILCDDKGNPAAGASKIYPATTKSESGTSYRFVTPINLSDGFAIGKNYVIGVEGYDQSEAKNAIIPASKGYGFHMATTGKAPTLTLTSPDSTNTYINTASQLFKGSVTVEVGAPTIVFTKDGKEIKRLELPESSGVAGNNEIIYPFEYTFTDFGTTSGNHKFTITAVQDTLVSQAVERTVVYDVETPTISITAPATAKKFNDDGTEDTSKKYVNGNISFTVVLNDKGGAGLDSTINKPKWEILDATTKTVLDSGDITEPTGQIITKDTTDAKLNGKKLIIRVTVYDIAGNKTVSDDSEYTYTVDQTTDVPRIFVYVPSETNEKPLNFELDSIADYDAQDKTDKKGTVTRGDYLKFYYYDDDGNVKITIRSNKISSDTNWISDVTQLTSVYDKSKDVKVLSLFDEYQFPKEESECGTYELAITLTDGNKTTTVGPFVVNVTKESASLLISSTPEYAKDGNKFTNTITIVPSIPDYEIYRKFGENDYETTAWKTVSSTATADLTFDDEIAASTLTEDEVKVTYKVIDGNNQTSKEVYVVLKKDNNPPETVTITAPVEGKIQKSSITDNDYSFRGTLKDSKSGIAKLWYCFTNSATPPADSAYERVAASDGSFNIDKIIDSGRGRSSATTENLCEGEWYLHIKAEDKAGNVSTIIQNSSQNPRQFDIDKAAPELTESNSDDLGYKNATFTLSGTVKETNGLESIIITDSTDTDYSVTLTPTSANNQDYSWTTDVTGLSDGKHTLTITAKDKATKETTLKRFVTVDTVAPVVADSMTLPTGKSFDAATITISGTATDAAPSSGLSKVEYWFADDPVDPTNESNVFTAEGTSYWSATISRTELSNSSMGGVFAEQGEKYIFVKAYDNAGNASTEVSKLFVYDTEDPVLSSVQITYTGESAVSLSDETVYTNKDNYEISGNFTDTGSNVTVGVTSNGQELTVTQPENSKNGTWSFTTSELSSNTYNYIITAADKSGRTDEKKYSIVVDKNPPDIDITKPGSAKDDYINSNAYTFTGTITETYLKTLKAKLYKTGVTDPVKTDDLYPVNGGWSWTVTNLDNAEYTVILDAEDMAGNTGTATSAKKVIVDTVKPTISFISDGSLYDMSGDKQDADAVLTAGSTYFTKGAFTLKGTANDANFDAASIKVGETTKSFTSGGSASGAWTYSQIGTDGEYVYTISATDKANNPASATITVKVDTSAPDKNEITAPANATRLSAISETTYIFKGNAKDKTGGTGVSKILYAFTNSSTAPTDDSAYTEQAASDGGWSIPKTINSGTAATENTDNLYEGNWYLHVKAKDLAGNVTSAVSKAFDIDFENPSIEIKLDSVVLGESTEQGKNAAYTFTFKITESNKLDATNPVSITIKKDNVALTSNDYSLKQGETTISALTSVEKDKEYTIVIPDATDALYTYVITAKDLVGKTTTVTRNIRLDTTAPVISVSSPEADTWQSSNNFNVIGTAADSSGTQAVYYVLNPTTVPAIPAKGTAALTASNWTGWNADAKGKDNWNISLSDVAESTDANTHNILYLAAVDTMGNVSTSAKAVTLKVDTAEPTLTPKFYQIQDADSAVAISDADTIYVNNADGKSVTIYGEYKNAKSGVNALTINGATVTYSTSEITNAASISSAIFAALPEDKTTVKSWKAVFTSLSEGNNRITLNGSSVAGIQVSKTCNIIRDITKPSIPTFSLVDSSTDKKQYSSPSTGNYYVNNTAKKFTLSGTASDTYGIASVTISGVTADFSGTKENWKFKEFEIQGTDGDSISIEVIVTDKAGNIKKQPITVNIDTVAPKGKHVLDSANKDLYFRIGDQDRDVVNGTTTKGKITTVISGAPETIATTTDGKGKDQKVGGKYAGNTYGDTETITLRGRFDDEGSGVERIYYKVVQTSPDDSDIADDFLASYETLADGYFLLSGDETKRVFYTDGDSKTGEGDGTIKRKADGTWVDKDGVNGTGTFTPVNGRESGTGASTKVTITTTDSSTETPTEKTTYQFYSDVTTNYKTVISNFMPGENYLMFVAVDNVGNADYETVEYMGVEHHDYRINIDQVTPNIENTNEVKYSNGKLTIDIDGKVNDALAGIASMEVYTTIPKVKDGTDKKKITFDVTLTNNGIEHPATTDATVTDEVKNSRYKLWTANIDTSTITYDDGTLYDGTVSLNATARDKAGKGNPATVGIGSIIMDIKPTNVSLTAPTDADEYTNECQVNGTISLSGTAKDENGLSADSGSLVLYYTRNTTLGAKTKTTIAAADIKADNDTDATHTPDTHFVKLDDTVANDTSWTFSNIDTASLKKSTTKNEETEKVWFMVASKDIAGNFGYSDPCAVIVDPHSDRPVILFEEGITLASDMASSSPSWVKNRQIKGKVKDDDGVTHLYYSFTGNESDWSSDCLDSDKRGFTINLNSNGSDDDKHTIYFKVVTADGEYITKAASSSYDALSTPKLRTNDQTNDENNVIIGNDSENDKYDTTLYVNIDLKNPDILVKHYTVEDLSEYFEKENGSYKVDNIDTALIANNQPNNSFEWEELKSSFTTGGPSNYLYVLVKATDANGINSITLKNGTTEITGDNKREAVDVNSTTALFRIDVSSILEDASEKELEITVTDKANKPVTNSSTVTIDRKAPVVTITTPSSGSSVYGNEGVPAGSVTVSGNTSDGHHVKDVYFAITKSETDQPSDNESDVNCWTKMTTVNASAIYAIFNGDTGNDKNGIDAYYGELFNWYVDGLYGAGTSVSDDRKNVCLWFYAEDEYGNAGKSDPTKVPLLILTQGDKPEVNISYPTTGGKVGGTITLSGSTSIATDTVDKVYIQIDPDYDSSSFSTANWESRMNTVMSGRTDLGYTIVNTGLTGTANSDKTRAIVANGSAQSWYLNINMQHEFDNDDKSNRKIAVRVFAVGKNNGKVSNVQTVNFTLDPGSPIFGNTEALRLVQYENNVSGTGEEKASLLYTKDMWIKGKWWLTGSIEDDSGIQSLTLNEKEGERRNVTTISTLIKTGNEGIITGKGYILNIPVGVPEDNENCYANLFDIVATDGEHSTTQEISLNYDNTAPTFSANLEASGNSIVQSQGSYTISGSFKDESGSGFKRIAFYVTRKLSNVDYLTDIMGRQGTTTTGIPNNCVALTGFTAPASGAADLYWKKIIGCTANSAEITLPSSENIPSYVHVGGLCRINNVIYRIEGVNESSKTITLDQKVNSGTVNVEFTVAQVIDNTVSESGITTYYGDETNLIANDDHDYMCESYSNSNGSWSVTINSKNIKDGAITLHFVAYDKAGNAIATSYNATVANNRPRIAGVKFGSDVDGSGTVETSEMKTMYAGIYRQGHDNRLENVTVSGQTPAGKAIYTLAIPNNSTKIDTLYGKPVLTVKGKVKVVPEIVGGNDGLSWTYYIGSSKSDDNIVKVNGARKVTTIVNTHSDDIRVDDEGNDIETAINLELGDIVGHYTDDGPNDFHFQIWDHTEGLTPGTNSNRADLSLRFYVALQDGVAPEANIRPFYWKDSEHNSVFYENNVAKGHIELEDDLPEGTFNVTSTDTSGLYDNDPKVSGIIYLEGTAKDNVVVEEILMKFPGLTTGTGFVTVAKRNRTAGSENLGKWEAKTSLDDDGFEFVEATETTDTDSSTGLDYNMVNFKIKVNTAKISGTAGTDKQIQVQVKDRGGITAVSDNVPTYSGALESSVTGEGLTDQTKVTEMAWLEAKNLPATKYRDLKLTDKIDTKEKLDAATIVYVDERTPTYKVDVVPYITKITTPERNSSGLKDENIRSASGRYSVIKGSTTLFIKVEGFNLNVATGGARIISSSDVAKTNLNENSGTAITFSNKAKDYTSVYLSNNISKSGYLEIFAGTEKIRTLNNINKTDAHGSYTITGKDTDGNSKASASDWENFYNREPDLYKTNNIQLTDDRYLLGWDMKTTTIKNGYYPDMIVNKKNTTDGSGNIVFSYLNPTGGVGNMSYKANFQPQRAVVTVGTGATKSTENLIGGMAWDQMAMAQDESGRYVHVTSYNYNEANMSLIYDRFAALSMTAYYHGSTNSYYQRTQTYGGWGSGTFWSGQYLTPSHVGNNNALTLDSVNYSSLLLDRYKNLRLIAQGNSKSSTDPARVYIGFYDDNSGTVYFRNMKIGTSSSLGNQLYKSSDYTGGNVTNTASDNGTYTQYTNFNENTDDPESDNSKNWTTGKSTVGTSATEHFDIGVDSNKVAIVVYYGADGYLHLKYKTGVDGSSPNTALTFSENTDVTFPKGVGQYVSMAIDASNGIHIAAFDVNTSDLRYIYMTAYNAKTYTSMIVDAAGSVGNWTSIKIDTNSDHSSKYYNKPVIAYYNSTETGGRDTIKLATANATIGSVTAGVDESTNYTSTGWEYMTVPSITPAQGGNAKFRHVNLDFDAAGNPVVGYLGAYLEYGQQVSE